MGNHEDEDRRNGYIGDFVQHCPDRMNVQGLYGPSTSSTIPSPIPCCA